MALVLSRFRWLAMLYSTEEHRFHRDISTIRTQCTSNGECYSAACHAFDGGNVSGSVWEHIEGHIAGADRVASAEEGDDGDCEGSSGHELGRQDVEGRQGRGKGIGDVDGAAVQEEIMEGRLWCGNCVRRRSRGIDMWGWGGGGRGGSSRDVICRALGLAAGWWLVERGRGGEGHGGAEMGKRQLSLSGCLKGGVDGEDGDGEGVWAAGMSIVLRLGEMLNSRGGKVEKIWGFLPRASIVLQFFVVGLWINELSGKGGRDRGWGDKY
ncbi:hypothetical protein BDZ91DRAFT_765309 [Kalaharituber pfeilii]|nr:hypothetical protein BDZ91DRAFT_765309 [Kalaharituber pfeilii]